MKVITQKCRFIAMMDSKLGSYANTEMFSENCHFMGEGISFLIEMGRSYPDAENKNRLKLTIYGGEGRGVKGVYESSNGKTAGYNAKKLFMDDLMKLDGFYEEKRKTNEQ